MKVVLVLLGLAVLCTTSCGVSAAMCDGILDKAPADAKSKFKSLPTAALEGDMQSACLLLKAGKKVDDKNK
jgi:hypothetical protein